MKTNILILVATVILSLAVTAWLQTGTPLVPQSKKSTALTAPANGKSLPAFELKDMGGRLHKSSDFAGKTMVINFWATWCPPCIVEFPRLLEIARIWPDNVVLIAVSSDTDAASINRFTGKMTGEDAATIKQDNVYIVHDAQSRITFDVFQTAMLPETIIVNPQQQMVEKLVGAEWTIDDIRPFLPPQPEQQPIKP